MCTCRMQNLPTKLHPDQIWNHRALGFFEDSCPQQEEEEQQQQRVDMKSVPGLKETALIQTHCSALR